MKEFRLSYKYKADHFGPMKAMVRACDSRGDAFLVLHSLGPKKDLEYWRIETREVTEWTEMKEESKP